VLSNLYRIIDFIATAFAFGAAFLKLHATRALPTKLLMAQAIGVKRNKKKNCRRGDEQQTAATNQHRDKKL